MRALKEKFDVNWDRDIHMFAYGKRRVLIDVNSGSVHLLDKAAWDMVNALKENGGSVRAAVSSLSGRYPENVLAEVAEELSALKKRGVLFTGDSSVEEWAQKKRDHAVKSLCLNVAHACNMRCGYCFAADVSFRGKGELMSEEVGKRAVDFLLEQSKGRKHLEVDFFGGEPLLNLETVRRVVEYGSERAARASKEIRFTLTTNCLLIDDDFIKLADDYDMQVVLSLDGREDVHDSVRRGSDGSGTYEKIVPKMLEFVESRDHGNYYVRGTYTKRNTDFSKDVLHIFDAGFKHVSLEPVVSPPDRFGFSEEDLLEVEKEYEKLVEALLERVKEGRPADFFHFNVDIKGGTCIPKRIKGCGAGTEYLAVAPDGTIYPCHQFVGKSEFAMGSVFSSIKEERLVHLFDSAHIYNKPQCRECWARFLCSGGCHASAWEFSGSILKPYGTACRIQKKRLECGIYFQIEKYFIEQNALSRAVEI